MKNGLECDTSNNVVGVYIKKFLRKRATYRGLELHIPFYALPRL